MQTARDYHARGILLSQIAIALIAVALLIAAYQTARSGFKLSKTKTLTGPPARALAVGLAVVGGLGILLAIAMPWLAR